MSNCVGKLGRPPFPSSDFFIIWAKPWQVNLTLWSPLFLFVLLFFSPSQGSLFWRFTTFNNLRFQGNVCKTSQTERLKISITSSGLHNNQRKYPSPMFPHWNIEWVWMSLFTIPRRERRARKAVTQHNDTARARTRIARSWPQYKPRGYGDCHKTCCNQN